MIFWIITEEEAKALNELFSNALEGIPVWIFSIFALLLVALEYYFLFWDKL